MAPQYAKLEQGDFATLAARIRAGDDEALGELIEKSRGYLLFVIRRRLRHPLRKRFDSDDFVQKTAEALVGRDLDGPLSSRRAFLAFLTTVVENEIIEQQRRHLVREKVNLYRETPLETLSARVLVQLAARAPFPDQVVALERDWQEFLAGLEPQQRDVLRLEEQGHTCREIADQLKMSERSVRYQLVQAVSHFDRWWQRREGA